MITYTKESGLVKKSEKFKNKQFKSVYAQMVRFTLKEIIKNHL